MTTRTRHVAVLALTVSVIGSCAVEPSSRTGVSVRDSAGVSVVEHAAATPDTLFPGAPLVTIGHEGDPDYEFHRIQSVQGLSDGRIVVADGGSQELRYYSEEGLHLTSIGGRGQGPGEFQFLNGLERLAGDTIVANDARNQRASFFSPAPEVEETLSYIDKLAGSPPEGMGVCAFPGYAGLLAPRGVILWDWACVREEGATGIRPYHAYLDVWSTGDARPLRLGPFTVSAAYERPDNEPRKRFTFMRLAERSVIEAADGEIYVTSPGRYELRALAPDGSVHLIIRDRTPRRAVNEEVRASVAATRSPEDEELPFPDSLPAWDRIVVGGGQIWLRHFVLPTDSVKHWSVYTKRGDSKRAVAFPSPFDLTAVLGGRAYGTTTSDLGIERVQVFDLVFDR